MSGWGRDDGTALTGTTVGVTNGSPNVTGIGTAFLTDVKPGQVLMLSSVEYVVKSVTTNTALVLESNYAGATNAALAVASAIVRQKPTADKTKTTSAIYGVNAAEVAANPGVAGPGWVHRRTNGARVIFETLVAMKNPPTENNADDTDILP